jgi:superfamily II DNA/RNA helicase
VSHIFNFDVPSHAEDYVHRIGRTGRAGKTGTALMICVPRDEKNLEDIERLVKQEIPRLDNPMARGSAASTPAAKDETAKEKPTRVRRTRKPKDAPKPNEAAPAAVKPETKPETKPAPAPVAKPTEKREANQDRPRGQQPRQNNRRGGGNNTQNNQVKGMGTHMPDFIAKSFDDRRDS